MTCADFEVLLCDYLDAMSGRASVLTPEQSSQLERHMAACPACAELARDAGAAVRFISRAAEPEPPPELLTRILFELPFHKAAHRNSLLPGWLRQVFVPILQPRVVMGMALTILSFSMMVQCAGVKMPALRPADLAPSRVWAGLEDRAHRTWERTVKSYESIRLVYEMQSRLRELVDQQPQEERGASDQPPDDRRLPGGEKAAQPDSNRVSNQTH